MNKYHAFLFRWHLNRAGRLMRARIEGFLVALYGTGRLIGGIRFGREVKTEVRTGKLVTVWAIERRVRVGPGVIGVCCWFIVVAAMHHGPHGALKHDVDATVPLASSRTVCSPRIHDTKADCIQFIRCRSHKQHAKGWELGVQFPKDAARDVDHVGLVGCLAAANRADSQ